MHFGGIRAVDGVSLTSTGGSIEVVSGITPPDLPVDLSPLGLSVDELPDEVDLDSQIITVTLAGSGSGSNAAAGVISLNWLKNNVTSSIKNSVVTAYSDISVIARDMATVTSIAVGGSGSANNAGGVAISFNYIGGNPGDLSPYLSSEFESPDNDNSTESASVNAVIENSTVNSQGGLVRVDADAAAILTNVSIGGAGSGNNAIGGSISINFIR